MSVPTLPILMYHHVSPNPGLVTLSPAAFREQMAWLARSGWHTPGAREIEAFHQGQPLPRKSVVITFDDGYLDNWVHAQPAPAEHKSKSRIAAGEQGGYTLEHMLDKMEALYRGLVEPA